MIRPPPSALLAAAVLAAPIPGRAQEAGARRGWTLEAEAGVALPAGELAELAEPGASVAVGASYGITPAAAARLDLALDRYRPASPFGPYQEAGPGVRLWRGTAGVVLRFTDRRAPGWSTLLGAGGGAALLDTDPFLVPVTDEVTSFALDEIRPVGYARLRVAYAPTGRLRVHAGIRAEVLPSGSGAGGVLGAATEGAVERRGPAASFPLTAGASVRL